MTSPSEIADLIYSHRREKVSASLSMDRVREWLRHEDANVRGAAYTVLSEAPETLDPHPSVEEFVSLALDVLARTIGAESTGYWAFSGYEAAWNLASWFSAMVLEEATPRPFLETIVARLGTLYEKLDEHSRETLVNRALEHMFEHVELRDLFCGWKSHPVLARAYADSCLWGDKGGDSPLVGSGQRRGPADEGGGP